MDEAVETKTFPTALTNLMGGNSHIGLLKKGKKRKIK